MPEMEDPRRDTGVRNWRIGVAIAAIIITIGAILVWQIDLLHLHFSYADAKKKYLASGMPFTSDEFYSGITLEQAKKRAELVESAEMLLKGFRPDPDYRYDNVSKANSRMRLQQLTSANLQLDRVAALSDAPIFGYVELSEGVFYIRDYVSDMRRAVQLLALRGEWRVTIGDFEDGKKDLEAAYRIANSLGQSEFVIGYLAGHAAVATVDQSVVKAAEAVRGNIYHLKDLEKLMQGYHASYPMPINALKGEALSQISYARNADILKDIFSLVFQDSFPGAVTRPISNSGDPRSIGRRSLSVAFMQLWAGVGDSMQLNPGDPEVWLSALKNETAIGKKKGGMSGSIIDIFTVDAGQLSDSLKRTRTLRLVNLSLIRGMRMSLEGKFQSEIGPAMEIDPYSGKPLVWKSTGLTFTVWSVGPNGTDDGGISRAEYQKLMGTGTSRASGSEAYDVPVTIPWKPIPRPTSAGGLPAAVGEEDS